MMGLGMMIGAGVFVGIGMCSHSSGGGGLMVTFALNGLIALFSALSFAELASAIPRAGGTYNFARIAFGRPASFIAGWMEWLAASAAGGFYALVLMQTVFKFCVEFEWIDSVADGGWMGMDWRVRVFALGAVLVFVLINFRGSSETGKLGAIFTVGQMLFVVAIGIAVNGSYNAGCHQVCEKQELAIVALGQFVKCPALGVVDGDIRRDDEAVGVVDH